jgi:hypothetical protein
VFVVVIKTKNSVRESEGKFMFKKRNFSVFTILLAGLLMAGVALAANVPNDQPDSFTYVGYDSYGYVPAYKDTNGVSIPFIPTRIRPSIGYQGDFYVDEFTDAKIKQAWKELKVKDPNTAKKILAGLSTNTDKTASNKYRVTGWLDSKGVVNGNDDLKLADIRRPAFFGHAPYFEDIGKVEKDTYTVEFTVPRDPYERLQLNMTAPVKLRGWFIKGKGVLDTKGKRIHALVIFNLGNGGQLTAISHPDAPMYVYDTSINQYKNLPVPNKNFQTERWWSVLDRQYLYKFNYAGFDVLLVDKRGHGISGGVNAANCAEMAEDIFRILDQLETGVGLTVLAPTGQLLQGKQTVGLLLRGISAKQVPVLLWGESQGSQITCHAMQKNFIGWTAFNEADQKFSPAKKYNIKAAIFSADFAGGLGYVSSHDLRDVYREAAYRVEKNTMARPTSEILANIDKWPAVFFGKGLWDKYQSTEGTYEAYRRARGLKELVFLRGPHGGWGTENIAYLRDKMTEFAVRAVINPGARYPELKSFKDAVLSSYSEWEPTSRP